ncbi:hypothetical protein Scep_019654 [Stephania cephalantha]|uniref:Uncharacterized protein n=1 Tax=Stephania cephalantha TaxID=152367 RepID=A0AAP0NNI6_9MAGN
MRPNYIYPSLSAMTKDEHIYGLEWTPSGSLHRHATAGGVGGGGGAGSSRPTSSPNELVELLQRDF